LEVLRHCFPANLRHTLEELPKSLDETYNRVLKDINNANRDHAYLLLQCLAVASRPLRVEELAEVLAFDLTGGIPKSISDWRWEDREEAVLSACSSLVSVISDKGSRVVQFSHFSVKEFLTSDRLKSYTEEVSRFYIPIDHSHVILAQACLGVLLGLDDRNDEGSAEKIPLFRYAAEYWHQHVQIDSVESEIADTMDRFFDTDKPHFSAWVRLQGSDNLGMTNSKILNDAPVLVAPLCFAAGKGFRGLVERLTVKHPREVNQLDSTFGTPLHASASASVFGGGYIGVARFLLQHGADINSRTTYDWTPLHIASRDGHLVIGKWLLNHGADVDSRTSSGWSPLSLASTNGPLEVARILLEHNAEVNSRDDKGSPLYRALQFGKLDVTRLLLDYGADVNVRDTSGKTLLHLVAYRGHLEIARKLLRLELDAEDDSVDDGGSTPLQCASDFGSLDEVARLLLEHGADVHVRDKSGNTPLHFTATCGHREVARKLLQLNTADDSRDDEGSTPHHCASDLGSLDKVARLLLDYGADVQVRDNSGAGNTPLHFATTCSHLEVTRKLLKLNVEVNYKGSTPLPRAPDMGSLDEVAQLLLDHGADVHARDKSGNTPLHLAATCGHLEVVRKLLKLNAEVNSRDDEGSTPLLLASEYGHAGFLRLLLDHNADVHVRDRDGNTPLHRAAFRCQLEVARILLTRDVEVDAQNARGSTPLHLTAGIRALARKDTVKLLLDHGADVHARNINGQTASEACLRQSGSQTSSQRLLKSLRSESHDGSE
jgi:ankyrin repeat protein